MLVSSFEKFTSSPQNAKIVSWGPLLEIFNSVSESKKGIFLGYVTYHALSCPGISWNTVYQEHCDCISKEVLPRWHFCSSLLYIPAQAWKCTIIQDVWYQSNFAEQVSVVSALLKCCTKTAVPELSSLINISVQLQVGLVTSEMGCFLKHKDCMAFHQTVSFWMRMLVGSGKQTPKLIMLVCSFQLGLRVFKFHLCLVISSLFK